MKITQQEKDELLDALNHLDEIADIGADSENMEKEEIAKSYNFLFGFISELKVKN